MKEVEIDWNDNVEGKFVIKKKELRIHGEMCVCGKFEVQF